MSSTPISTIRRLVTTRTRARAEQPRSLVRAFSHPEGSGVIGPGTQHLLRAMLVDALVDGLEQIDVVIAQPDLEQLLGDTSSVPPELLASTLHMFETLEDTIEHLENTHRRAGADEVSERPPILWLASPGPDADVVHQTLKNLATNNLIALVHGPWPYGPTHLIDMDGPRQLPTQNIRMLSRNQAAARLHIPDTRWS
ncbi:hypothetical protein [Actinomadura montaniterrae]|uniref:Uncharacterized protein n=1 Tax=Actinomadura montaniterrae TaxID=1803903 RepID=A0A6L3W9U5_9ACTN|nr:hypothetical protein [Actinomadura montaniterrae]KAB2388660.1 hypothetical protein F9B16_03015 [Actinomadura montaniterrae]